MRTRVLLAGALACWTLLRALPAAPLEVPAKSELEIRLRGRVSTQDAKAGDKVEGLVIAPVLVGQQFAIPAGAIIHGVVEKVTRAAKPEERSLLVLKFVTLELAGNNVSIAAKVAAVDNARERVDDQGQINGILSSETVTGQLDTQLSKLETRASGLASVLSAAKNAVLKSADTDIIYDAGVEMRLQLTAALSLKEPGGPGPAANLAAIGDENGLAELVAHEPFQTVAQNPPKPSDITNILLIAEEDSIKQAFADAGWSTAAGLSSQSKLETFRALAENRGYKEAPVSVLLLDGSPPGMVFEKLNNTFAQRHHLRVWRRPATFGDKPVWAIAATHDIGISFSEADHTFIHRIDSQIDRERAKVVNDLILTGRVQAIELLPRQQVPQHSKNATGDELDTDGQLAVLILR